MLPSQAASLSAATSEPFRPRALRAALTWRQATRPIILSGLSVAAVPSQGGPDSYAWEVRHDGLTVAEVSGTSGFAAPSVTPWPERQPPAQPRQFRALAQAVRHRLRQGDLARLAAGDIAGVLGAPFGPGGTPTAPAPAAEAFTLLEDIVLTGAGNGRHGQGRVTATLRRGTSGPAAWPELLSAAWQALHVHALHQGMHLVLPDPRPEPWTEEPVHIDVRDVAHLSVPLTMQAEIASIGLVPRPHVVADIAFGDGRTTLARLHSVGLVLREPPGRDLGPGDRDAAPRRTKDSGSFFAHELHMAHASEGDLRVAHGTARHRSTCLVRPRLPRGDLLMVDRMVDSPAEHGEYPTGSSYVTEYDVPTSPWYIAENAGSAPHLFLLETSLQAAAFVGASLGAYMDYPDHDLTVRNLEGCSRLLRAVDLRGRTIRQRTTLLAHTPLPGATLQRYGYELAVAGATFYTGEAVHGFFTAPVLARQQGLDGGRVVPPWLKLQTPQPVARPLDPATGCSAASGRLAFLARATTEFVENGGRYGLGYLLCEMPIDPADWFFDQHFLHDPVMPGSCGVELLVQMTRACVRSAGLITAHEPQPEPLLGAELRWTYRGQIQPHHQRIQAEVHVREVVDEASGRAVTAEGSVWRDGLRIYAVDNIALHVPALSSTRGTS
ncbi:3-hydroxyacyl-ACP dehydratase [Streptomyces sp. NPDC006530]|uniref:3-hydroxyacyl-ACP dehydratase n=1 Tax=Streptomyces sp. NPDC006530 TaxID=3364750 RepID=UPI00367FFFAE